MKAKKLLNFKILTGAVLLVMFLSIMTPFLFYPKQVQAQMVVHDPIKTLVDKVWEFLKEAWRQGAGIAYKNAINTYTSQIATQTAEWVASGGKGQNPLFITDPTYWTKMGDNMLGEFIDAAAKSTGFFKQSLCDPIDPTLRLNILISFDPLYRQKIWSQETRCSFTKIRQRISEAQQKNLIEFSIDLKEGPIGRYKSSFKSVLEADSVLTNWGKGGWILGEDYKADFKNIAQKIIDIQDNFSQTVQNIQANKTGSLKEFPTQANFLDSINNQVWGAGQSANDSLYLKYWQKNTPICSSKNRPNFCSNQDCLVIGNVNQTDCEKYKCKGSDTWGGDCKEEDKQYVNYINALSYTNRANLYVKQLVDWTNTLEGMIKKTDFTALTTKQQATLEDIGRMYNPEGNDIGVTLTLQSNLFEKQTTAVTNSKYFQSLQGRMNDVTTKISGLTKTPSPLVDTATRQSVEKGTAGPMQYTGVAVADAIGVFTNTLINNLLKQIFEKGYNANVSPEIVARTQPFSDGIISLTQEQGKSLFTDLAVASLKKGGEISIYDEYAVCPQDSKYALPSNCVMDSGMVRALEENLTLKQAMDKNLIHPDWLVSGRSKKDAATDYLSRYSLTNIKKLRAIRVFPLGLEIAAQKIYDSGLGDTQFTLKDVVDGFNKLSSDNNCTVYTEENCGTTGSLRSWNAEKKCCAIKGVSCLTPASPFCHLVDPSWVLKAPSFQCETIAYSSIPLPGSSQRQETCVDMKDCIHEDANGKCDTWGYCTREKNIWRAGGNSCDSQFNTCQTYTKTSDKKSSSYLANTLNFANCSASDVGCKWYCSDYGKGLAANNQDIWACTAPGKSLVKIRSVEGGNPYSTIDKSDNAIFFNRNVEKCDAGANGCHEYIRTASDLGTNLVPNGDFNYIKNNIFSGWNTQSSNLISNASGYNDGTGGQISVSVLSGKSADFKIAAAGNDDKPKIINYKTWAGIVSDDIKINPQPYTRYFTFSAYINISSISGNWELHTQALTGSACPVASHTDPSHCADENLSPQTNYTFDSTTLTGQWIKKTRIIKTDPGVDTLRIFVVTNDKGGAGTVIVDKAQIIETTSNQIVSTYTDYGSNNKIYLKTAPSWMGCNGNNPSMECSNFATICKSEDAGCGLYTPINNDPTIPGIVSEGNRCLEKCVGTNNFKEMDTNFETGRNSVLLIPSLAKSCSAPGCEEFTNLDEVAKGGEGVEYYSYIRTCQKPDTQTCGYYYTWVGSDTNGYQLKKYYLQKTDSASNEPAATNMAIPADWGTCLNAQDAIDHPHCKEFYAADGTPYYKFYENTITCSDDCHSLRRTTDTQIYNAIPDESVSCSKANINCREYKGNAASNVRQILKSDFEDGTNQSWIGGENSNNSVTYLGHSMKITSEVKAIEHTASGLVTQGKSYIISFWAKGRGTWSAVFSAANKDPLYIGSTLSSNEDWREIKLGPVYFNREVGSDEKLIISPALQNSYIDNIILKEVKDDLNLIKDSWKTKMPAECTVPGCQAYKDQNNKFQYLTSFARLCDEKSVGCEALIDTQNSISPFAETFKNGTTVPADNLIYLINDSKKSCQETNKGCQKFGLPTLSAEQTVVGWSDLYLKNNPDNYTSKPIICDSVNTGCEEYNLNGSGGSVYFKDPGENLCEWREKIMVGGENKTGWFTKGTDQPCYYNSDNTPYQVDGTYGIKINTEANYKNIAGICPQKQTGCTQFTDSSAAAGSQNYYYLNDGKLDQSSCQGMVSQKQGCVLLSDNSLKNANGAISASYNTLATYEKSKANNYGLVAPIDCSGDKCKDSIDSCQSECSPTLIGEICRAACVTKYINDANIILKVAQDRTCGEWLTCTSSRSEWDKTSGSYKDICEAVGRCNKLIGIGDANQCGHLIWEQDPQILNAKLYQDRDISWSGMDYSGHSIYNMYPIERLWAKEYKDGENSVYRLTYMMNGKDDQGAGVDSKGAKITIAKTCRAYPEKDSPFKNGTDASYFSGVNVCSEQGGNGENKDCQCSYKKLENQGKGTVKYCNYDNEKDCQPIDNGDKLTQALGLRGFCLEPDPSKPTDLNACITWWPGKAIGDPDIYNQFQSAGYVAPAGKEWYCTEKNEGKELVILSADYSRWCCSEKGNSSKTCSISSIPSEFKNITLEKIEKITAETGGDAGGPGANCGGYDKGDWPWEWGDLTKSGNYYYLQRDSTDGYGMIKVYFTSDSPNATIDKIEIIVDHSNLADPNTFKLYSMKIYTKPNCGQVVNIADNTGMTQAFTNRVNNIRNYNNDSIDNKTYTTLCQPWGALGSWDKATYITQTIGCGNNMIDSSSIYSSKDIIKNNLFAQSYSIYDYISPGVCQRKCQDGPSQNNNCSTNENCGEKTPAISHDCVGTCSGANRSCETDNDCFMAGTCGNGICKDGPKKDNTCQLSSQDCSEPATYYTCGNLTCSTTNLSTGCNGKNIGDVCETHPDLDYKYETLGSTWKIPSLLLTNHQAPQVAATTCNEETNTCHMGSTNALNHITIGNVYEDGIDITRVQSYLAVLKFYAWADKDQMPIRDITIDWGDSPLSQYTDMKAKNHKDLCCSTNNSSDGCPNGDLNFGNIPEACTANYFQFTHIYRCFDKTSPGWSEIEKACVFKPRVYVQDNWYWCNGEKYAGYDNKCKDTAGAGTQFGGKIIIKPQE